MNIKLLLSLSLLLSSGLWAMEKNEQRISPNPRKDVLDAKAYIKKDKPFNSDNSSSYFDLLSSDMRNYLVEYCKKNALDLQAFIKKYNLGNSDRSLSYFDLLPTDLRNYYLENYWKGQIEQQEKDAEELIELAITNDIARTKEKLPTINHHINAQANTGNTALHLAVLSSQFNIVKLFIEKNANPNIQNKKGYTPLHLASNWGKVNYVKLLLDIPTINPYIKNDCNETALDVTPNLEVQTLLKDAMERYNIAKKNSDQ